MMKWVLLLSFFRPLAMKLSLKFILVIKVDLVLSLSLLLFSSERDVEAIFIWLSDLDAGIWQKRRHSHEDLCSYVVRDSMSNQWSYGSHL